MKRTSLTSLEEMHCKETKGEALYTDLHDLHTFFIPDVFTVFFFNLSAEECAARRPFKSMRYSLTHIFTPRRGRRLVREAALWLSHSMTTQLEHGGSN